MINDLRIGGAETLVRDLCPALRELGVEVEVAALAPSDSFLEAEIRAARVTAQLGPGVRSPQSALWLRSLASRFDLVHVHLWPAQLWAALGIPRSVPMVTTEHNTDNRRRHRPFPFRPLDALTYRRYERIIAVSRETARALGRWTPAAIPRTTVIENGLPLVRFRNATPMSRETLDVPNNAVLLVCVGRMEPVKDHATLLRAMNELPECHLALAGDGPLRPELEGLARAIGVAHRVRFLGGIPDIPALLAAADLYVQPSKFEGFPRATGEAMASGLPVVVSDGAGFSELVGDAALRFPVGDGSALARAVRRALSERARSGPLSLLRAETLSIEDCARKHLDVYEAILREHRI